ncbi:hypothetical protein [Amycolatopsis sacchari]|uniref:Uncharacterized protein n=1 Tax=Amycolatopsis sacchari TaxID=115433 RepID=A0A1I3PB23_9PSEU|nr:hypothetical protein [Amycolatopsis sacchari]SFJ18705.1 hypothetical protein SAMN05421835_103352 [Amycolatopsis sacchari]
MSLRKKVAGAGVLVAPLFLFMSGTASADPWHDWSGSSYGASGAYAGSWGAGVFDQSASADDDGASYAAEGSWAGVGGAGIFDVASSSGDNDEDGWIGHHWSDNHHGYTAGRHKITDDNKCGGGCDGDEEVHHVVVHESDDNGCGGGCHEADEHPVVVVHDADDDDYDCGCHDVDEHHTVHHVVDRPVVHHHEDNDCGCQDVDDDVVYDEVDEPVSVAVHHESATSAGPGGASSHGTAALAVDDHSAYAQWSHSAGPAGASSWHQLSGADEDGAVYHTGSAAAGPAGAASYSNTSGSFTAFGDDD